SARLATAARTESGSCNVPHDAAKLNRPARRRQARSRIGVEPGSAEYVFPQPRGERKQQQNEGQQWQIDIPATPATSPKIARRHRAPATPAGSTAAATSRMTASAQQRLAA